MKAENTESSSLWTKAPVANLVRYEPSGIYFARAKVRGKLVRKSLDTNILSVAKLRLGAFVLCATECSDADSDHQAGQKEMAVSNSANGSMPDSDKHSGHDDSACNTLKTLVPTTCNLVLLKPDFGFCTLSFISPPQAVTVADLETSVSRQPPDDELIFTPEVSLGAAFYSLAPPVLA